MPQPFRWDLRRREQLGRLVEDGRPLPEVDPELRRVCARAVAFAGEADLIFIGRSPEPLFDYLSGLFFETPYEERLKLLNVSLHRIPASSLSPAEVAAFRDHARPLGLDPLTLHAGPRSAALVDVVAAGGTFGAIAALLLGWAEDEGVDPKAVRRRLRFLGLTFQTHTSPKTWRWQQHAEWAKAFPPSAIKNVSVAPAAWTALAGQVPKVGAWNPPRCWADDLLAQPTHTPEQLAALRSARALFERGLSREERHLFSARLAEEPAIREPWCRAMIRELRGRSA